MLVDGYYSRIYAGDNLLEPPVTISSQGKVILGIIYDYCPTLSEPSSSKWMDYPEMEIAVIASDPQDVRKQHNSSLPSFEEARKLETLATKNSNNELFLSIPKEKTHVVSPSVRNSDTIALSSETKQVLRKKTELSYTVTDTSDDDVSPAEDTKSPPSASIAKSALQIDFDDVAIRNQDQNKVAVSAGSSTPSLVAAEAMTMMIKSGDGSTTEARDKQQYVTEVSPRDVIFRNGKVIDEIHLGNKRYAHLIASHKVHYHRLPKVKKLSLAKRIVGIVRQEGGLFLEGKEAKGTKENGLWLKMEDLKAMEVTNLALKERGEEKEELIEENMSVNRDNNHDTSDLLMKQPVPTQDMIQMEILEKLHEQHMKTSKYHEEEDHMIADGKFHSLRLTRNKSSDKKKNIFEEQFALPDVLQLKIMEMQHLQQHQTLYERTHGLRRHNSHENYSLCNKYHAINRHLKDNEKKIRTLLSGEQRQKRRRHSENVASLRQSQNNFLTRHFENPEEDDFVEESMDEELRMILEQTPKNQTSSENALITIEEVRRKILQEQQKRQEAALAAAAIVLQQATVTEVESHVSKEQQENFDRMVSEEEDLKKQQHIDDARTNVKLSPSSDYVTKSQVPLSQNNHERLMKQQHLLQNLKEQRRRYSDNLNAIRRDAAKACQDERCEKQYSQTTNVVEQNATGSQQRQPQQRRHSDSTKRRYCNPFGGSAIPTFVDSPKDYLLEGKRQKREDTFNENEGCAITESVPNDKRSRMNCEDQGDMRALKHNHQLAVARDILLLEKRILASRNSDKKSVSTGKSIKKLSYPSNIHVMEMESQFSQQSQKDKSSAQSTGMTMSDAGFFVWNPTVTLPPHSPPEKVSVSKEKTQAIPPVPIASIQEPQSQPSPTLSPSPDNIEVIVTDNDILCGRGGLTNHHKGNRHFRDLIARHRPDYVRVPKAQKPNVARRVVQEIRSGNPPGRFLKKDADGKWFDIGDKRAAEKCSQALREKRNDGIDVDA